jgi:superfamily I DNA and/or RNA helicase
LREADVIVSTSTGAADPRLLAACGILSNDDSSKDSQQKGKSGTSSKPSSDASLQRVDAPDGLAPLSLPFVIVDEACQSVEPATLIPITSTNSCRSIVMLGDPCQLPPTVRSGQSTPLSLSLMERLAATLPAPSVSSPVDNTIKDISFLDTLPVKQAMSLLRSRERGERQQSSYRKRFAGSLLLSIQYRMHPSIAAFPSAIFYDGLLSTPSVLAGQRSFPRVLKSMMPCGDPNMCVRVIDVGGRGNERRGMPPGFSRTVFGSSPSSLDGQTSYWNEPEAQRVLSLIKDVLAEADPEVKTIGVVTPYNAQVQLIKGMIASDPDIQEKMGRLTATIEVKSVDGYQGRERDLIIFSAVRSNRQGMIGFLHDWRRMNVALTRAKSGLVVIGDLTTLTEADKYWDAFGKWAAGVRCVVNDFDSPEDEPSI